ncbi:MAG: UbiA family prenyltransferase [Pseudomonadota bacterium]
MTKREKWAFLNISRLHIAAIAAMGVFTFGWLFTGRYPWLLTIVVALDWYIVNLANRIADLKEDQANFTTGTAFLIRHRRKLLVGTISALGLSIVVVHLIQPAITCLRIFGHLLGVFYSWPLPPKKKRLKELYFWKNTSSALGFLITVFGYPLAAAYYNNNFFQFPAGISWMTVLFSCVFFFLFEVSYEIIYDLRDIKGDTLAGLKTYPVVHGELAAVYIIDILLFCSIFTLSLGYLLNIVPWRIFIMSGAPVLQFIVYKKALRRGISTGDCILVTWLGVSMFMIFHLWVLADLPGVKS